MTSTLPTTSSTAAVTAIITPMTVLVLTSVLKNSMNRSTWDSSTIKQNSTIMQLQYKVKKSHNMKYAMIWFSFHLSSSLSSYITNDFVHYANLIEFVTSCKQKNLFWSCSGGECGVYSWQLEGNLLVHEQRVGKPGGKRMCVRCPLVSLDK